MTEYFGEKGLMRGMVWAFILKAMHHFQYAMGMNVFM
jgi:hypothetical protein